MHTMNIVLSLVRLAALLRVNYTFMLVVDTERSLNLVNIVAQVCARSDLNFEKLRVKNMFGALDSP